MENVCRTCLQLQTNFVPLYTDSNLIHKIQTIASIQLDKTKEYPSNICEECVCRIEKFYIFRQIIIESDNKLKENRTLESLKQKQPNSTQPILLESDIKSEEPYIQTLDSTPTIEPTNEPNSDNLSNINNISETLDSNNETEYACPVCTKKFSSQQELDSHKHKQLQVKFGVCNVCGITVRADNLSRHVKLHQETPVKCPQCDKIFKNSESLRGHMYHHKGTSITCEKCGRMFKLAGEFKRHMKDHLDPGRRRHACSICGKKVRDLKRHINAHTGEKPYPCDLCGKKLATPYSLKLHKRQHTKENPYKCKLCSMTFLQKTSLTTHLKSKHNTP